jgi:hypothetical protein
MNITPQSKKKREVAGRLLQKMLMPIVATASSAAATYAAKKAPQLLEDRVLPKVRALMEGAGGVAQELPAKATSAAQDAGAVAERLTERARSVAGDAASTATGSNGRRHTRIPSKKLEQRREERERARAERRKAAR